MEWSIASAQAKAHRRPVKGKEHKGRWHPSGVHDRTGQPFVAHQVSWFITDKGGATEIRLTEAELKRVAEGRGRLGNSPRTFPRGEGEEGTRPSQDHARGLHSSSLDGRRHPGPNRRGWPVPEGGEITFAAR